MQNGRINKSPSKKHKIERATLEQLYLVALYFQNGISGGVSLFWNSSARAKWKNFILVNPHFISLF
jgi:hypothetical protein